MDQHRLNNVIVLHYIYDFYRNNLKPQRNKYPLISKRGTVIFNLPGSRLINSCFSESFIVILFRFISISFVMFVHNKFKSFPNWTSLLAKTFACSTKISEQTSIDVDCFIRSPHGWSKLSMRRNWTPISCKLIWWFEEFVVGVAIVADVANCTSSISTTSN